MNLNSKMKILVLCVVSLEISAFSHAAEKKIAKADLPPAVQKTAEEQSEGATVSGYSKETENGQLEYEVQMKVKGHSRDVSIAPDGRVLEVEEEVELKTLPATVQKALQSRAGQGKITKIESLTKDRKIVAYEAQIKTNGHDSEIQVGPDGERLTHEE